MNGKEYRELCWNGHIVENFENVRIMQHHPQRKNVAFSCHDDWESSVCGYPSIMKVDDKFRFYYRAVSRMDEKDVSFCVAESFDGKTFEKPKLCMFEYDGSNENNIFHKEPERFVDNFSIFIDTNPNCPKDEKFKALSAFVDKDLNFSEAKLGLYKSSDGLHFKFSGYIPVKGFFDSYNVLLWDDKNEEYRLYFRDFHDRKIDPECPELKDGIREVRYTVSKDLINWSEPAVIQFDDEYEDIELYTNQIIKYPRANIYFGIPTRYINRLKETKNINFKNLPNWNGKRNEWVKDGNRSGYAFTDCTVMFSYDGENFHRSNEAFLTPGIEREYNWVYGDCYLTYGLAETESDYDKNIKEFSMYAMDGYRNKDVDFIRYTIRMDGFFSWYSGYEGGCVTTVPIEIKGNNLHINFATSALGSLRVVICDIDGKPIKGYDSGEFFGDSLERNVEFEKSISEITNRKIKLKFYLKDCNLYSFTFV